MTPTPIIARPPAPPTNANRRGDWANQVRTALAATPHAQSETSPMQTDIRASASICPGTCPALRLMNCGRTAPNRMYAFGFVTPTTTPSRSARQPSRVPAADDIATARECRCLIACTPRNTRYTAPASLTAVNTWAERCSSAPRPKATPAATT